MAIKLTQAVKIHPGKGAKPRSYLLEATRDNIYWEAGSIIRKVSTLKEAESLALAYDVLSSPAETLMALGIEEPERAKEYIQLLEQEDW